MKVLVAEDQTVSRKVLADMVTKLGHEVQVAEDGAVAYSMFVDSPPQVLLTDWDMPSMDGLQLTKAIRDHENGREVFIIMLSGVYTLKENFYQAMDVGVNDFLTKPYTKRDLIVRLRLAEKFLKNESRIRQLEGLLPVCSYCKRIRDEKDDWMEIETYVRTKAGAKFSHGICPNCYDFVKLED